MLCLAGTFSMFSSAVCLAGPSVLLASREVFTYVLANVKCLLMLASLQAYLLAVRIRHVPLVLMLSKHTRCTRVLVFGPYASICSLSPSLDLTRLPVSCSIAFPTHQRQRPGADDLQQLSALVSLVLLSGTPFPASELLVCSTPAWVLHQAL